MQAQAADIPLKAPAAGESPALWWFHGEVEAGGRFFLNDPQRNGSAYLGQKSLAKFYEYRDLRPGPFGNVWLSTGTSDGLYQIDLGGKNIGYDDQSYYLDASKAGQALLQFRLGPDAASLQHQRADYLSGGRDHQSDAAAGLRSGRHAAQDITAVPATDRYRHQARHRVGSNIVGPRTMPGTSRRTTPTCIAAARRLTVSLRQLSAAAALAATAVPRPVDDTTQNFGLNGEYVGTSPWGQRFNFKLAYNGSIYTDAFTSYTIQDPLTVAPGAPVDRLSTWPSNNANAFSGTLGADLPWNSRYAGNISYTMMRQDDAFIPMSTQVPGFALPASSLNGAINTFLSNNVITTKLTPELTNKVSYRYYNFDNDTPLIKFLNGWISLDQNVASAEIPDPSLSMQYVKQNAGEELNWRPTKEWNVGAAYGFERYDWTQADVNYTNENSGKVYADWKPMTWFTFRSSGYYSSAALRKL